MHSVYVLIKDKKCVYVGCSKDVARRKRQHKKDKDFDSLFILKKYNTKKEALFAENVLIDFVTLFGNEKGYNKEKILLSYHRDFYL